MPVVTVAAQGELQLAQLLSRLSLSTGLSPGLQGSPNPPAKSPCQPVLSAIGPTLGLAPQL